jgi:DNA topoisomerase-2
MVLFTEEGVLKKYSSTKDILDSYCRLRYTFYIKRKDYKLKGIERQIKMLGNKKRFLEEVRDGDLKLFNIVKGKRESRKTSEIVSELEQRGYDKDLYIDEREDEGENEGEDEREGEDEIKKKTIKKSGNGYEYLLRLQISSVTLEKIERLKKDIDSNIEERDKLQQTSEKDMWKNDLDALMKAYYPYIESLDNMSVKKASKKVIKKM